MKKREKEISKKTDKEPKLYLTKRILVAAARRGIREAAKETMAIMGYNVIAREGWVVKIFPDGSIEKIKQINDGNKDFELILD